MPTPTTNCPYKSFEGKGVPCENEKCIAYNLEFQTCIFVFLSTQDMKSRATERVKESINEGVV